MTVLRAAILAVLMPATAWAQAAEETMGVVETVIEQAVRPGFDAYGARTAALVPAVEALCETPGAESLAEAREAFSGALAAWSAVEFVRLGPVLEENRLERTLFWPDPKGTGLKQVQALLAEEDRTATDAGSLAGKSVAVQGLGALEFVLFGSGSETLTTGAAPFRCAYASAIAQNLNAIAADMAAGWAAEDLPILRPGAGNPAYQSADESLQDIVQVLSTGFELIGDHKLRPVLGETVEKARPRRAVFRRSGMTRAVLAANLEGLKAFWDAADFATLLAERGVDDRTVRSVEFELGNAMRTLSSDDTLVEQAVAAEEGWGRYNLIAITMASIRRSIEGRLMAELGLTLGFNSLDGD